MARKDCRNADNWDYGIITAAEIGDRSMDELKDYISSMPPSNEKTIATVATSLSQLLFRLAKIKANEPLCNKIYFERDVPSVSNIESRLLSDRYA